MDINTRELVVLALMASFGLVLALAQDAYVFTAVFPVEASLAVIAAYRL